MLTTSDGVRRSALYDYSMIGLALLVVLWSILTEFGRGSAVGPASLLGDVIVGLFGFFIFVVVGFLEVNQASKSLTLRLAFTSKRGFLEALKAALSFKSFAIVGIGVFFLFQNLQALSQVLPGPPSEIVATITSVRDYRWSGRGRCKIEAVFRVESWKYPSVVCLRTAFGDRVAFNRSPVRGPLLLTVRQTVFYTVMEEGRFPTK